MNKLFVFLMCIVFFAGFVSASDICLDKIPPEAPTGLSVSNNLVFSWNEAMDLPEPDGDCNYGIDHYEVYLEGVRIGESQSTSYSHSALSEGTYTLGVRAVDRVSSGHPNYGDLAEITVTFPLSSSNGGNGGSGGGNNGGGGGSEPSSNDNSGYVLNGGNEDDGRGDESLQDDGEDYGESSVGDNEGSNGFFSFLTGAVIGTITSPKNLLIIILVLVIVGVYLISRKKKAAALAAVAASKVVTKKKPVKKV